MKPAQLLRDSQNVEKRAPLCRHRSRVRGQRQGGEGGGGGLWIGDDVGLCGDNLGIVKDHRLEELLGVGPE